MSSLLDKNNQPINTKPTAELTPTEVTDVRAIRTGTLIYNLFRYAIDEIGLDNLKHQLEEVKHQQKMVKMPPQYDQVVAAHADICERRFIIANELNLRFAVIDSQRAALAGLKPNMGVGENAIQEFVEKAQELRNSEVLAGFATPVEPADGG